LNSCIVINEFIYKTVQIKTNSSFWLDLQAKTEETDRDFSEHASELTGEQKKYTQKQVAAVVMAHYSACGILRTNLMTRIDPRANGYY
jgi:hypothetical protein